MPIKILIVDDEPGIVVPVKFLMEQQGCHVITTNNGEDALDLIHQHKPDFALLDIMLPGIHGYEVCEIMRFNPDYREVKIAFFAAKGRETEIAKGLAHCFDRCLLLTGLKISFLPFKLCPVIFITSAMIIILGGIPEPC